MKTPVILIAAMAHDRVIGRDGGMPWHLPADLKHFKATTLGCPMVMGRRTWESFGGRPLPGRPHLLVSRSLADQGPGRVVGASVFGSVESALGEAENLAQSSQARAIYVIGGGTIYTQTLGTADQMILTEIDLKVAGDTRFPAFSTEDWVGETLETQAPTQSKSGDPRPGFNIRRYRRR